MADGTMATEGLAVRDQLPAAKSPSMDAQGKRAAVRVRDVTIPVEDGVTLAGTLYAPAGAPKRAVLVSAATGVAQSYYASFANWLAVERQALVLTYDYRDSGASLRGHPRDSDAKLSDWGIPDQVAAFEFLARAAGDFPVEVVGNSLGGMFLAFYPEPERIARAVTVGAGPGNWLAHPLWFTPQILLFWWLIGPLATALLGYMPGKALGFGADIPSGVYWEWRRWCLDRRFYQTDYGTSLPYPRPERLTCPIRIVGVTDDMMITPETAARMANFYAHADVEHMVVSPEEGGAGSIGHLGLFHERNKALWPRVFD